MFSVSFSDLDGYKTPLIVRHSSSQIPTRLHSNPTDAVPHLPMASFCGCFPFLRRSKARDQDLDLTTTEKGVAPTGASMVPRTAVTANPDKTSKPRGVPAAVSRTAPTTRLRTAPGTDTDWTATNLYGGVTTNPIIDPYCPPGGADGDGHCDPGGDDGKWDTGGDANCGDNDGGGSSNDNSGQGGDAAGAAGGMGNSCGDGGAQTGGTDTGPSYDTSPSYTQPDPTPATQSYDPVPSYTAPSYDPGPSYDAGPSYDSGPSYDASSGGIDTSYSSSF
ncbi:hypothetical protein DFH06DRAFT_1345820 [Mycena polygramma]|nr:hypothetical protein DFH06DRAFT_1345820 [Mycena polygramma]